MRKQEYDMAATLKKSTYNELVWVRLSNKEKYAILFIYKVVHKMHSFLNKVFMRPELLNSFTQTQGNFIRLLEHAF